MGSLFDREANADALRRIENLGPNSSPRWGKMDAAQMFAHCCRPFRVASGELKLKRGLVGFLLGGVFKRNLVNGNAPFKPNLPTGPEFLIVDQRDFAVEQAALAELVRGFSAGGPESVTRRPHPFFGRMNPDEWDRLMWKHLDHHLRQFGV